MANKSTTLTVLEALRLEELRDLARWRGISVSGGKSDLAERIATDARGDLAELVRRGGAPWGVDDWNDLVENAFEGRRRRSFLDVQEELERVAGQFNEGLYRRMEEVGVFSIAQIREDERFMTAYAAVLQTTARRLENYIAGLHGNVLISSIWADLVMHFEPRVVIPAVENDERQMQGLSTTQLDPNPPPQVANVGQPQPAVAGNTPDLGYRLRDRWRVVALLGRGGFGTAWEVVDERLKREARFVAKLGHTSDGSHRLEQELHATLKVAHPNICKYHLYDHDARFGNFLILQHGGRSLHRMYQNGPAPIDDALQCIGDAARGLDYLHNAGTIHGDVSPSNILVDESGQVRLTDFGISSGLRAGRVTDGTTQVADVIGRTDAFASPEALSGKMLRRASDQASLAKVFCALLCGVDAYHAQPRFSFDHLHAQQSAALDRALLHDASRRFPTCSEFALALRGVT